MLASNLSALVAGSVVFFLRLPLLDFLQSNTIAGSIYYVGLMAAPLFGVIAATFTERRGEVERQLIRSYLLATVMGLFLVALFLVSGTDGLIPRSTGEEQVFASIVAIGLLIATVAVPILHPLIRTISALNRRLHSTGR